MEIINAFVTIFEPINLLMILSGCLVGIIFGAIPGLSGTGAMILLMPLTYRMDHSLAIAFLISLWVGGCSGSFIGSILLGIPGEAASIATCFDGHPMAKKGEAVRALSAGCVANFIGTAPSCIVAMIACPLIAKIAIMMGPWEYFALCCCAISMVVSLSQENIFKGFISVAIGLLLACVGLAPVDAAQRFTFGVYFLKGGFSLTYVMLGVFAAATILVDYAKGQHTVKLDQKVGKFRWPKQDLINNAWNILRSWLIGVWIGFLPGMGAGLSNVTAYAVAKSSSKHPEEFGKGTVEGVFAPETANNASIGGAMIPMIALGIPGDTASALLLGALMIHGIEPGPLMVRNNAAAVNVMFTTVLFAALAVFVVEVLGMRVYPKILQVPKYYLYPAIILLCFLGAYSGEYTSLMLLMVIIFAVLGIIMQWAGLPTSPMILSFILGPMLESNLRKAISYADTGWLSFFQRPASAILLAIAICCAFLPLIKTVIAAVKKK